MQQNARDEPKVFSQARDERGGRGITVYVIDTDQSKPPSKRDRLSIVNKAHSFPGIQGNIRWLHLPGEPHIDRDDNGHGTCVTSQVLSPTYGVPTSANMVVVKILLIGGSFQMSHMFDTWAIVAHDIASTNLRGGQLL